MSKKMKIHFVSDISCPWCIIGLRGLEQALSRTGDLIDADITFQPFELNPNMGKDGQNIVEHIAEKYGSTPEQSAANRAMIRERAADLGFTMQMSDTSRIYNTFDAHRLLHWAHLEGKQAALKNALFSAYFTDQQAMSEHGVLTAAAVSVGLDPTRAAAILASDEFADDVRTAERLWQSRGISAVPAVVINDRYLISGGQPSEAFESALRDIAAEA
ncbi:Disulfide bond formation protein DsbA [Sphingomonas aurantiaca]|uniref:Disulfide bond formation protein DsbA n=2 Tax=Sphingomonas aurantiaca TaxID=185949 RepID=A0A5E7Y7H5_9SPHN|nr:DsbA family oxidoreductase [Sphingomonas aurantiaca]VVT02540.1 Disulfide bond formation protein DsbA [Sphingomonas aurantiaca]